MGAKPSISIIGFGRVGTAMYQSLKQAGYSIESVFSKSSKDLPEYKGVLPSEAADLGELVFITVTDDQLEPVATELMERGLKSEAFFVHCSGTMSSNVLKGLSDCVASFHPMKAVTKETRGFEGIWFDVEGEASTLMKLEKLAEDLRIRLLPITEEAKPFLHAASVMASNYLVALAKLAQSAAEKGGIDPAKAMAALLPLIQSSLGNMERDGIDEALTGPIDRAEVQTVRQHLKVLQDTPELLAAYKMLGLTALSLSKSADEDRLNEIRTLLE